MPKYFREKKFWRLFYRRFLKDKKWLVAIPFCVIPPFCLIISPVLQWLNPFAHSIGEWLIGLIGVTSNDINTTKIPFPTLALSIMFGYNIIYTASMAVSKYVTGAPIHRYFPPLFRMLMQLTCICLSFVCEVFSFRALGCLVIMIFLCWSICSILLFIDANTSDNHADMENDIFDKHT